MADDSNACLIKLDESGNIEWSKVFGNSNYWENGYSVAQTDDNGYIFAGEYFSSETNRGGVWLVKVDINGTEEWNKTFSYQCSFPLDYGFSVHQTSDGGFIIGSDNISHHPAGWVIKTDRYGNKEWEVSPECFLYSVDQTNDGGYIAVGTTGNLIFPGNLYLVKISSSGVIEWARGYGRESLNEDDHHHESGRCVRQTSDGGYIIVGYRDFSIFGFLIGLDIWVLKTDENGNCDNLNNGFLPYIFSMYSVLDRIN